MRALWLSLLCLHPAPAQESAAPSIDVERVLFVPGGDSHSLAISPDGTVVASGGDQGDLTLLRWETGELLHALEASDHWIGDIRFSPDGDRVAALGRDLTVWDVAAGRLIARHDASGAEGMDWSRDGRVIACATNNEAVTLFDGRDLTPIRIVRVPDRTAIDTVALSRDASLLAVGKRSGKAYVYDAEIGRRVEQFDHDGWVSGVAFLDDGQVIRAGRNGDCFVFGRDVRVTDEKYSVWDLATQPDGSRCAIRTAKATVVLDRDGSRLEVAGGGPIALHPDGRHWVRARYGRLEVMDDERTVRSFDLGHREQPRGAVLSGDGRVVLITTEDAVTAFDTRTGEVVESGLPKDADPIPNPFGPEIVVKHGDALEWWLRTSSPPWRRVRTIEAATDVNRWQSTAPRLTARGRVFTVGDSAIDVMDPAARPLDFDSLLMRLLLATSDGERLVGATVVHDSFGGGIGDLRLYDGDGKKLVELDLDVAARDLDLSPSEALLAMASNQDVRFYRTLDLRSAGNLPRTFTTIRWLDETTVIGATSDGHVEIWGVAGHRADASLDVGSWVRELSLTTDLRHGAAAVRDRVILFGIDR